MPAPTNANGLSLGRPVIDPTTDDTATLKELLAQHYVGAGYPCGARDGDDVYMAVYAQSDGGGGHILYGGNPTDPTSPHVLTVSAAGSATVIWQDEGSTVATYGTVSFEGAGVTVTDGGTKAIVTIPGGSGSASNSFETWAVTGGGSIVADSATDTATFTGGTGITITATAGSDTLEFEIDTSEVAQHSFKTIAVGASNVVADSPTDTLTLVEGFAIDLSADTGTDTITIAVDSAEVIQNVFTVIAVSGQTNVEADDPEDILTLVAGPGHTITTDHTTDTITHKADVNDASHVGLVDPTTGADSTADDAQIGILWHEIQDYAVGRNMLIGHLEDDSTKPVVQYKTTEDWLELLESYDSSKSQVIYNDSTNTGVEDDERVRWVDSPQKVIWGLDPDGGHTITTSGTTLTLTLKVTKYTFDAVNFVSAVDADVTVTYTGTECA